MINYIKYILLSLKIDLLKVKMMKEEDIDLSLEVFDEIDELESKQYILLYSITRKKD